MKILHFDSVGGASGDMILGALAGLGVDLGALRRELTALLPDDHFEIRVEPFASYGINGQRASVIVESHAHHHAHDFPSCGENPADCIKNKKCKHGLPLDECVCHPPKKKKKDKEKALSSIEVHETHGHHHDDDEKHHKKHKKHKHHHHDEDDHHHRGKHKKDKHGHSHEADFIDAHEHVHGRTFKDIRNILKASSLPEPVKASALKVFTRLAEAEGKIHGKAPEDVHFHEVGAVDSIVDITGSCLALEMLGVDKISVSSLPIGHGLVKCAHGLYPLPAPATVELLKCMSVSVCDEDTELVTPTGAALLSTWKNLDKLPENTQIKAVSYSFGKRELKGRPNLLRAVLYETLEEKKILKANESAETVMLECNVDDMSPEIMAHAFNSLLKAGALDVFSSPVFMKKQRQGILLSVLCVKKDAETLSEIVFRETSTLGIRETKLSRRVLERNFVTIKTSYGKIKIKEGILHGKTVTASPEYEDCVTAAEASGVPLKEIFRIAMESYSKEKGNGK